MQNDYYEKKNSHQKFNFERNNSSSTKNTYDNNKSKKEFRDLYEDQLSFLGFIIISNQLKNDTANVISQLKDSGCHIVMATGDNPFTSLSVAKQCGMIASEDICLIDKDDHDLYLYV